MVVPQHPAAAAQAAATGRLTRLLSLGPTGVVVRAAGRRLDDLPGFVRAMRARVPDVRVATGLSELHLLSAPSPVIFVLHREEAASANLLRPVFARSRVILWGLADDERALRAGAADLLDIATAWIELPSFGPPPFATAGLLAMQSDRAARAAVWTDGDAAEALASLGQEPTWLGADAPWNERVAAAERPGWVCWTGVDDPIALDAVRWAHAGRPARALILRPLTPVRGVWQITGAIADPRAHDERAAHLDFEAEAIALAQLLPATALGGADPGAVLAERLLMAHGAAVIRREAPAPLLRAAAAAGFLEPRTRRLLARAGRSWRSAPIAAVRLWAWTGETRRWPAAGSLAERDRLAVGPALAAGAAGEPAGSLAIARIALEGGHRDLAASLAGPSPWIRGLLALSEHRYADAAAELELVSEPAVAADRAAVSRAIGAPPAPPALLVAAARRAAAAGNVGEAIDLRTAALLQRGRIGAIDAESEALALRLGSEDHPLVWRVRFRAARLAVALERPDGPARIARLAATGRRALALENPRFRLYQAIVFSSASALAAARRAFERSGLIHSREAAALLGQEIQRAWRAADREGAASVAGDLVSLAVAHDDALGFALGQIALARTRPPEEARARLGHAFDALRGIPDPARPKAERLILAALAEDANDEEAVPLLRRALARGADPWLRLTLIERLTRLGRIHEAEREKSRLRVSRDPRAEDARRRLAANA